MGTAVSYYGRFSDSGSRNSFYEVKNSKYGFKSFPTKNLASFSHAVQSRLSLDDLAPRVYSPVGRIRIEQQMWVGTQNGENIFRTENVLSDWGYLTEIAKPYHCPYEDDEYGCSDHCFYEGNCKNYNKIRTLMDKVEECGIEYTDAHNGNLGWVMRKKKRVLVVIDVGRESVGEFDYLQYPDVDIYDEEGGYDDDHCSCSACRGES